MKLREDGASLAEALKFSSKMHCRTDITKQFYGPTKNRSLKPQFDLESKFTIQEFNKYADLYEQINKQYDKVEIENPTIKDSILPIPDFQEMKKLEAEIQKNENQFSFPTENKEKLMEILIERNQGVDNDLRQRIRQELYSQKVHQALQKQLTTDNLRRGQATCRMTMQDQVFQRVQSSLKIKNAKKRRINSFMKNDYASPSSKCQDSEPSSLKNFKGNISYFKKKNKYLNTQERQYKTYENLHVITESSYALDTEEQGQNLNELILSHKTQQQIDQISTSRSQNDKNSKMLKRLETGKVAQVELIFENKKQQNPSFKIINVKPFFQDRTIAERNRNRFMAVSNIMPHAKMSENKK